MIVVGIISIADVIRKPLRTVPVRPVLVTPIPHPTIRSAQKYVARSCLFPDSRYPYREDHASRYVHHDVEAIKHGYQYRPHRSNIQRMSHSSQLGSVVWRDKNGASRREFKAGRMIGKRIRHGLDFSSYYLADCPVRHPLSFMVQIRTTPRNSSPLLKD